MAAGVGQGRGLSSSRNGWCFAGCFVHMEMLFSRCGVSVRLQLTKTAETLFNAASVFEDSDLNSDEVQFTTVYHTTVNRGSFRSFARAFVLEVVVQSVLRCVRKRGHGV